MVQEEINSSLSIMLVILRKNPARHFAGVQGGNMRSRGHQQELHEKVLKGCGKNHFHCDDGQAGG